MVGRVHTSASPRDWSKDRRRELSVNLLHVHAARLVSPAPSRSSPNNPAPLTVCALVSWGHLLSTLCEVLCTVALPKGKGKAARRV